MADRVLASQTAVQSVKRMQSIINGSLLDQIAALDAEGKTLSDPNVWDGNLAIQFRNEWPTIDATLRRTKDQLEELRGQMEQIVNNILLAGGNLL